MSITMPSLPVSTIFRVTLSVVLYDCIQLLNKLFFVLISYVAVSNIINYCVLVVIINYKLFCSKSFMIGDSELLSTC